MPLNVDRCSSALSSEGRRRFITRSVMTTQSISRADFQVHRGLDQPSLAAVVRDELKDPVAQIAADLVGNRRHPAIPFDPSAKLLQLRKQNLVVAMQPLHLGRPTRIALEDL